MSRDTKNKHDQVIKQYNIRMQELMVQDVDELAKIKETTRSELFRIAVQEYLVREFRIEMAKKEFKHTAKNKKSKFKPKPTLEAIYTPLDFESDSDIDGSISIYSKNHDVEKSNAWRKTIDNDLNKSTARSRKSAMDEFLNKF